MASKLSALLDAIDPSRTYDESASRVDQAINRFPMAHGSVNEWRAFQELMTAFFRHLQNGILRIAPAFAGDSEMDWDGCRRLLVAVYGRNGEKAAFEMARTGNEGGLYGVLKTVAARMAEDYAKAEVRSRVGCYWELLSAPEKLAATDEYLRAWRHLLPWELTEGSAARLRMEFTKVLEEHPANSTCIYTLSSASLRQTPDLTQPTRAHAEVGEMSGLALKQKHEHCRVSC
jgi:hypothetical protein